MSKPSSVTRSYYSELGHAYNSRYFKNCGVHKGKFKWVPKGIMQSSNNKGPKFN